ncbi:MAG: peptidoglycan editing factor PgeF [Dermabacter sp.]|nr:peptidoglycan editing factor PgeF [Dermabacter sp.]
MTTVARARVLDTLGARARVTSVADGNLALHVGDDAEAVRARRRALEARVGAPVVFVSQVHSATVQVIDDETDIAAFASAPPEADALVSARSDIALAIMVADCVPVLFSDPDAGIVGAAHAGRRGLLDGILERTVDQMRALGAEAGRIRAYVGPSICGACYEVPALMQGESLAINPALRARTSWNTPALDLKAGAAHALARAGLSPQHIAVDAACTREDHTFYSYRRDPACGRFAGVIRGAGPR